MILLRCAHCNQDIPVRSPDPLVWCPRCGKNFQAVQEPVRVAAPAPPAAAPYAASAGGRAASAVAAPPPHLKVQIRCSMQYACAACGSSYRLAHVAEGEGRQEAAEQLQRRLEKEADCPCPTCGLARADRVARARLLVHGLVAVPTLLTLAVVLLLALAFESLSFDDAGLLGLGVTAVAGLLHLIIAFDNPNRNRAAQRERAAAEVAAGRLEVLQPGKDADAPDPARWSLWHRLALAGLVVAPAAFLVPLLVRHAFGWPTNPDLPPYVIGPGDEVRIPFPDPGLRSIGGRWRARASAELLNAGEVRAPRSLAARSKEASWGDEMYADNKGQRVDGLYAYVTVPNNPSAGGKNLRVRVTLDVTYPKAAGMRVDMEQFRVAETFEDHTSTVTTEAQIQLTEAGGSRDYRAACYLGAAAGGLGYAFGGVGLLLLALARRLPALPPRLVRLPA